MRRTMIGIVIMLVAVALAIISGSACQRMGSEYILYEGTGPGIDSTLVVVGGWPLPYLFDSPYLSPRESVSFTGGIVGVDDLRVIPFLGDIAICLGALLLMMMVTQRVWGKNRR